MKSKMGVHLCFQGDVIQFQLPDSVDKLDLEDLGAGEQFKPPMDPLFTRSDETIRLGTKNLGDTVEFE